MKQKIDPKTYGLPPKTILIKIDKNRFTIFINRKSRIIMKDARAFLKKVDKIKESVPSALITLETTAPVCSKSVKFLQENKINVVSMI